MKTKLLLIVLCLVVVIGMAGVVIFKKNSVSPITTTTSVQFVNSVITADGIVTAQNKATLNFQTSGKLVYLPLKEGDKVYSGQTIARLDSYALQHQLAAALNTYKSTRDTFDQTQQNSQDNVLKTQVAPDLTGVNTDSTDAVNTAIQRIADQSQSTLNNSVINVELANYALQLSTLTSPLSGIITHEDVVVPGINITPAASFIVADPDSMVFRANIPTQNIYYITEGSSVSIAVDGIPDKLQGTVIKIYPSRVTLPSGEAVYQVDIESDQLKKLAKLDETGTAIISTNSENVALVPAWTVLAGKYIWVNDTGTPELREITAGKIHGNEIEILSGLTPADKIITDPKFIPSLKYQLL